MDIELQHVIEDCRYRMRDLTIEMGLKPDQIIDVTDGDWVYVLSNPVVGTLAGEPLRNFTVQYELEHENNKMILKSQLLPVRCPQLICRIDKDCKVQWADVHGFDTEEWFQKHDAQQADLIERMIGDNLQEAAKRR